MLLFHLGIYGNCCCLNILVITNRHYIVSDWFYQVITIHSNTTQICSKQLIFSRSANNSHPASDYITWPQYISASFIHILVPYFTKQKMSPRQLCLVICPVCQLNRGFQWRACLGNFGPRGLAACAVPLPLGWCTGLAASAVDLLHLAFDSKPKLLSLSMDLMIWRKLHRQLLWWGMDCNGYDKYLHGACNTRFTKGHKPSNHIRVELRYVYIT